MSDSARGHSPTAEAGGEGVWRSVRNAARMAEPSLNERLSALEAELEELERRSDARLDAKLKPLKADLTIIRHAVAVLLKRLT